MAMLHACQQISSEILTLRNGPVFSEIFDLFGMDDAYAPLDQMRGAGIAPELEMLCLGMNGERLPARPLLDEDELVWIGKALV